MKRKQLKRKLRKVSHEHILHILKLNVPTKCLTILLEVHQFIRSYHLLFVFFFVEVEEVSDHLSNLKVNDTLKVKESKPKKPSEKPAQDVSASKKPNETSDPDKKLKNLKKRLREVETLEEKIKSGTIVKPEPEQLTKIKRKNDLLLQIHELEKQIQQGH